MSVFRRRLPKAFKVVGRDPQDYAQEFQEFINQSLLIGEGQPAGFLDIAPPAIQAGTTGDPGISSDGWMPPSAIIPIETGPPIGLSNSNGEGTGTALMRASALIKRDVRVAHGGSDVGTRNRLNFIDTATVTATVVDDGGSDEIDISFSASGGVTSALDDAMLYSFFLGR